MVKAAPLSDVCVHEAAGHLVVWKCTPQPPWVGANQTLLFKYSDEEEIFWVWTNTPIDGSKTEDVKDAMIQHLERIRLHRAQARTIFKEHGVRHPPGPVRTSHVSNFGGNVRHTSSRYDMCIIEPIGTNQYKSMGTHICEKLIHHVYYGWYNDVWYL